MLRGQVFERGPEDLVLTPHAIGRVLTEEYGVIDPEAPTRVHALTGGWPALVHFAADALSRRPADDLAGALTRPGSSAATWLETEVLAPLPAEAVHLLAVLAELEPVTPDLADQVLRRLDRPQPARGRRSTGYVGSGCSCRIRDSSCSVARDSRSYRPSLAAVIRTRRARPVRARYVAARRRLVRAERLPVRGGQPRTHEPATRPAPRLSWSAAGPT